MLRFAIPYSDSAHHQHSKYLRRAITTNVIKQLINKTFHKFKFRGLYCDFWLAISKHKTQKKNKSLDCGSLFQFPWWDDESLSRLNRILIDNNKLWKPHTKREKWANLLVLRGPLCARLIAAPLFGALTDFISNGTHCLSFYCRRFARMGVE